MSGIFPNRSDGAVLPNETIHGYDPVTDPTGTEALYFPQDCNTIIRPETVNSLISEIACVIDKAGLPYDTASNCNLFEAIKAIILAATITTVTSVVSATCSTAAPASPAIGAYWLDSDASPLTLWRWSGVAWVNIATSAGINMIVCDNCGTATVYINCGASYQKLTI